MANETGEWTTVVPLKQRMQLLDFLRSNFTEAERSAVLAALNREPVGASGASGGEQEEAADVAAAHEHLDEMGVPRVAIEGDEEIVMCLDERMATLRASGAREVGERLEAAARIIERITCVDPELAEITAEEVLRAT